MNNNTARNYLLISSNKEVDNTEELFKVALKYAEKSKTVLHLSFKQIGKLPGGENADKTILKRIIFMYFPTVEKMIQKLLELHSWSLIPHVILFDCSQIPSANHGEYSKKDICLMFSLLFNVVQALSKRLNDDCLSLSSINTNNFLNGFHKLLIDLYFYNKTYTDLDYFCETVGF